MRSSFETDVVWASLSLCSWHTFSNPFSSPSRRPPPSRSQSPADSGPLPPLLRTTMTLPTFGLGEFFKSTGSGSGTSPSDELADRGRSHSTGGSARGEKGESFSLSSFQTFVCDLGEKGLGLRQAEEWMVSTGRRTSSAWAGGVGQSVSVSFLIFPCHLLFVSAESPRLVWLEGSRSYDYLD